MPLFGKIVIIKRSGQDGSTFPLIADKCLFGRGNDCDIRVQLPNVSREHCMLTVDKNEKVHLTSLTNTNLTLLNGLSVTHKMPVNHKNIITVIDRNFRFEYPPNSIHRPYFTPEKDEHVPLNYEQVTPVSNAASVMKSPIQIPAKSVSPSKKKTSQGETSVSRKKSTSKSPPSQKKVPEKSGTKSPKRTPTPSPKNIKKPGSNKKKSPISGKVSIGKRKLSPNIDYYGTSTKKKRVSFGPVLSPEQFDISMPPSTPLKRGSFPSRRTSVPNYFGSPILTHFATLRKGHVSEVPRERKINEESPQKKSTSSPKRLSSENNQKENALSKKSSKSPPVNKKKASPSITASHVVSVNHLNESISKTLKVNTSLEQKSASVKGSKITSKTFYASAKKRNSMPNQLLKQKYESSVTKRRNSDSNIKRSIKNSSNSLANLTEVDRKATSDNSANGPICVIPENDKERVCNKLKNLPNSHGRYKTKNNSLTPKASRGASLSITEKSVERIKSTVKNSRSPRTIKKRSSTSLLYGVKSPQVKQIQKARKAKSVSPHCIQEKKALKSSLLDITCNGNKQLSSSFNKISLQKLRKSQSVLSPQSKLGLSERVISKTPSSLTSSEMGETITRSSAKKRMISPEVVAPTSKPATPSDSKKFTAHATEILTPLSNINRKATPRVKSSKTPRKTPKSVKKHLWSEVLKKGLMQKGIVSTKQMAKKLVSKKSLKMAKIHVKSQTATPLKAPLLNSTGHADSPATIYITKKVKVPVALTRKGRKTPHKNIIKQMKIGSKKSETPETSFTGVESLLKTPEPFSRKESLSKSQSANSGISSSLSPEKIPNISDDQSVFHKGKKKQSGLASDFLIGNSFMKSDAEISLRCNARAKKLTPKQDKEKEGISVREILEYTNVTVNENDKLKSDEKTMVNKIVDTSQRTPPECFANGEGVKETMHAPSTISNVDYRTVNETKRLAKTSKSAPRAVKRLVHAPQADYRNVEGIKRLFKTAKSEPKALKKLVRTPQADYRNVEGIKRLVRTPRTEPKALKKLVHTPQADYRNVEGIKRLVRTPRSEPKALKKLVHTPQADYRNVEGIKRLVRTPRSEPKALRGLVNTPEADYTNVNGIKRLVRTPMDSPKADYSNIEGVKRLLHNPEKSPQLDYTDVEGVRELMKQRKETPRNIEGLKQVKTSTRSLRTSFSNLSGIHSLFKTPKTVSEPDFTGLADIFVTPEILKQSQTPASKKTKRTKIRHTPSTDVISPSVLKQKVKATINDAVMKETEEKETSPYLTTCSTRRGEAETVISVKNKNQVKSIGSRISSGIIDNEDQPEATETPDMNLSSTPKRRRGKREQIIQDQCGNLVLSATRGKIKETDTPETNISNTPKGRRGRKPQQNQEQNENSLLSAKDDKSKQKDSPELNVSHTLKRRRNQKTQGQGDTLVLSATSGKIKETDTPETNISNTPKGRRGRKPQQNQEQNENSLLSAKDDKSKQKDSPEINVSNTLKRRRSQKTQGQGDTLVLSATSGKIKETDTHETNISNTPKGRRGRKIQQNQEQSENSLLPAKDDKSKQKDSPEINVSNILKRRSSQKTQGQGDTLVLSATSGKIKETDTPETNIANTPKGRRGRKTQQNQEQNENSLLSAKDDKSKQKDSPEINVSNTLKRRSQKTQGQGDTLVLSATSGKIKETDTPETNIANTPKGRRGRKPQQNQEQSENSLLSAKDDKSKQKDSPEINVSNTLKRRRSQKTQGQGDTLVLSATSGKIKETDTHETNISNTPKGRSGRKRQQNQDQGETYSSPATDNRIKHKDTLEVNIFSTSKRRRGRKQQLSQDQSESIMLSVTDDKIKQINSPETNVSKTLKGKRGKKPQQNQSEILLLSATDDKIKQTDTVETNVSNIPKRRMRRKPRQNQNQSETLLLSATDDKAKQTNTVETTLKGRRSQKQLNQNKSETSILSATDEKIKQINSPETNVSNTIKGRRGRKPQQNQNENETLLLSATDDKIKQADTPETFVSRALKRRRGQTQQLSQNQCEIPVLSSSTDKSSVLKAPDTKAGFDKTPDFNISSTSRVVKDTKKKKLIKDKSELSAISNTSNISKVSGILDKNVSSTPLRSQNNRLIQEQSSAYLLPAKVTKMKSVENTDRIISSTPIRRKGRPKKTLNESISEKLLTGTLVVTKRSSLSPDTRKVSGLPKRKKQLESNKADEVSEKDSSVISVVEVSKDDSLKQVSMLRGRKLHTKEDHVKASISVDQQVELPPKLRGRKRGRNQEKYVTPEQKENNIKKTQETSPTPAKKLKKMEEQVITPLLVSKKSKGEKFISVKENSKKTKNFQTDQNISNIITKTPGSAKQEQKKANNQLYKTVNMKYNTDSDDTLSKGIKHAQKTNTRSRKRHWENTVDISRNVEELSSVSPKTARRQTVKNIQTKSDLTFPHSEKGNKEISQHPETKVEFDKIVQNDKSKSTVKRRGQRKNQTLQAEKRERPLTAVLEVPAKKTRGRRVYESTESSKVRKKDSSRISPKTKKLSKTRSSKVGRKQVAEKSMEVDVEKTIVECDNIPNTNENGSRIASIKQEQEMSTQGKKVTGRRKPAVNVNGKSETPVKNAKGQNKGRCKRIQKPSSSGKKNHSQSDLGIKNTTNVQIPLVKGRRGKKAQSLVKTSQASPSMKTQATRSSTRAIKSSRGGSKQ